MEEVREYEYTILSPEGFVILETNDKIEAIRFTYNKKKENPVWYRYDIKTPLTDEKYVSLEEFDNDYISNQELQKLDETEGIQLKIKKTKKLKKGLLGDSRYEVEVDSGHRFLVRKDARYTYPHWDIFYRNKRVGSASRLADAKWFIETDGHDWIKNSEISNNL